MARSPHCNLRRSRRYANDSVWEYVTQRNIAGKPLAFGHATGTAVSTRYSLFPIPYSLFPVPFAIYLDVISAIAFLVIAAIALSFAFGK
ncbi:MAG: hypothetical protein F6K26_27320 [Moorea sp. SIO2I5]|nr:hypothetical protein [Moorena sp. SIO2I5]